MNSQLREERIERMRAMIGQKTLAEIGAMQEPPISRARVGQLVGSRKGIPQSMRLLEVYRFIENYIEDNGYPPSRAEISNEFQSSNGTPTSSSVVNYWLSKMASEKYDMIYPANNGLARAIVLKNLNKRLPAVRTLIEMEMEKQ